MTLPLVDAHCHLDLYPNHEAAFASRDRNKILTLAVTTTPRAWARNHELASRTGHVKAALGLHPELVATGIDEFNIWEKFLPDAHFIGEVGLDASTRFCKSFGFQRDVFTKLLSACAKEGDKVLSVHSLRAVTPVLNLIEAHLPKSRGTVILHWFTGTKAEASRAINMGCYFSINSRMTRKEGNRKFLESLPIGRILTESDGPFAGSESEALSIAELRDTVISLAEIRQTDPSILAETIVSNFERLIR